MNKRISYFPLTKELEINWHLFEMTIEMADQLLP